MEKKCGTDMKKTSGTVIRISLLLITKLHMAKRKKNLSGCILISMCMELPTSSLTHKQHVWFLVMVGETSYCNDFHSLSSFLLNYLSRSMSSQTPLHDCTLWQFFNHTSGQVIVRFPDLWLLFIFRVPEHFYLKL